MNLSSKIKVIFLVDGFNVYHSLYDAKNKTNGVPQKWLDYSSLCKSYLPLIGKNALLEKIYYFSAYANHRKNDNPDVIKNHRIYIKALESTGIKFEKGRFKRRRIKCKICNKKFWRHEEKETDVSIGIKLFELFYLKKCDIIIIVSGDTDLVPAVKVAKNLFPEKIIGFLFPYGRKHNELVNISDIHFKIKPQQYINNQFHNSISLPDGNKLHKMCCF